MKCKVGDRVRARPSYWVDNSPANRGRKYLEGTVVRLDDGACPWPIVIIETTDEKVFNGCDIRLSDDEIFEVIPC